MILVSVAIVVLPIALSPDERVVLVIAFDVTLLGVPLFFISPWDRARLRAFNIISGREFCHYPLHSAHYYLSYSNFYTIYFSEKLTKVTNILLETSSTRLNYKEEADGKES